MKTYVALLRGLNVGANNRLPMKALAAMFSEAGCAEVRTYIASGNVVFQAQDRVARTLPKKIAARIRSDFELETPVILRSAEELDAVARHNPFLVRGEDTKPLNVLFLAEEPTAASVAKLDPDRSPPDAFKVRGREIYLRCPNGVAHTKLTNAYFDAALKTVSTGRNWNTVLKLLAMTR
jgi:uncharacterized protein (DUF1697 family)